MLLVATIIDGFINDFIKLVWCNNEMKPRRINDIQADKSEQTSNDFPVAG